MFHSVALDIVAFAGAIYLLSPLAVRMTFQFAARCNPVEMPLEELPEQVAALFRAHVPQIRGLGFELIGCFDCGCLASETHSYVAYFCDRRSKDFANVSVVVSPKGTASYLEFSTRFTNGQMLETNTNPVLPLTPANPEVRIFRFPEIQDAQELLRAHRELVQKYAADLRPAPEPNGAEILRLVRTIENYGPRLSRIGYMTLARGGETYKPTWKGAFLMTWRGLWPVSFMRRWMHRHAMNDELYSLQTSRATALQRA